jgi:hypothetical protein
MRKVIFHYFLMIFLNRFDLIIDKKFVKWNVAVFGVGLCKLPFKFKWIRKAGIDGRSLTHIPEHL